MDRRIFNVPVSPLLLARLSSLSMTSLDRLRSDELRESVETLLSLGRALRAAASTASDVLYRIVAGPTDPSIRAALLRLRRDLFNARQPKPRDLAIALDAMTMADRATIDSVLGLLDQNAAARERFITIYDATLLESRRHVATLLDDERISQGVLLASPSLHASFRRYGRANLSSPNARDLQIERGILRYLTRAIAKATPFGSFCKIVEGRLADWGTHRNADGTGDMYRIHGSFASGARVVRLNKRLFDRFWPILKARPAVRSRLPVELNPTLRLDGDRLFLLARIENDERIQRIAASEQITLVIKELRRAGSSSFGTLAELIATAPGVEATPEEASEFLVALLDAGLLRFRSPVRSQESEWMAPLRRALEGIDDPVAAAIVRFLTDAEEITREYSGALAAQRASLSKRLRDAFDSVVTYIDPSAAPFVEPLLFEDCGADARLEVCAADEHDRALAVLADFVRRTQPLAYTWAAMASLRHFFDERFPDAAATVPLLELFEVYYRDHLNKHIEVSDRIRAHEPDAVIGYDITNPFGLAPLARLRDVSREWTARIQACWAKSPDAEEIHLTLDDCPDAQGLAACDGPGPRSVSVFCQMARGPGGLRVVVSEGRTTLGFGKYYSRFLTVVGAGMTDGIRDENMRLAGSTLVELAGDANHNVNFHPPLVSRELAYPTLDGEPNAASIRWDDLVVTRDPDNPYALALCCASDGSRVYPVDLGFLNPVYRPAFFQFLLMFSPGGPTALSLPTSLDSSGAEDATNIIYRPRIIIGGSIVVARRAWLVPVSRFPARRPDEASHAYFHRIQEWRRALGMPPRVYVRVFPRYGPPVVATFDDGGANGAPPAREVRETPGAKPASAHEAQANGSRDFRKPQFIDFDSPLLVALFSRIPGTLKNFRMLIEEQYPPSDQLPVIDGEPHSAEFVLQVHWRNERSGAS